MSDKTLIVLDISGSMESFIDENDLQGKTRMDECVALLKNFNNFHLWHFDTEVTKFEGTYNDLQIQGLNGGTDFANMLDNLHEFLKKEYQFRVFILTDNEDEGKTLPKEASEDFLKLKRKYDEVSHRQHEFIVYDMSGKDKKYLQLIFSSCKCTIGCNSTEIINIVQSIEKSIQEIKNVEENINVLTAKEADITSMVEEVHKNIEHLNSLEERMKKGINELTQANESDGTLYHIKAISSVKGKVLEVVNDKLQFIDECNKASNKYFDVEQECNNMIKEKRELSQNKSSIQSAPSSQIEQWKKSFQKVNNGIDKNQTILSNLKKQTKKILQSTDGLDVIAKISKLFSNLKRITNTNK